MGELVHLFGREEAAPTWVRDALLELAGSRLLPEDQAAEWLGVSKPLLELWRRRGEGPRYVRVSDRRLGYRLHDLAAYAAGRVVDPKSAA